MIGRLAIHKLEDTLLKYRLYSEEILSEYARATIVFPFNLFSYCLNNAYSCKPFPFHFSISGFLPEWGSFQWRTGRNKIGEWSIDRLGVRRARKC